MPSSTHFSPDTLSAVGGSALITEPAGAGLVEVSRCGLSASSRALKRCCDVSLAAVALIGLAPLLITLVILIRLDSPGGAFFRQARVGRDGKRFRIIKFRSMVEGADAMKADLRHVNEARDGLFKIVADPRITRIGRWLRRTHLDELPQLLNVIRGEMSLVGPRPLVEEEDRLICGSARDRLHLTPGMTGPWQILGPMTTPLSEMARLDSDYAATWNLWQDIRILSATARCVVRATGH